MQHPIEAIFFMPLCFFNTVHTAIGTVLCKILGANFTIFIEFQAEYEGMSTVGMSAMNGNHQCINVKWHPYNSVMNKNDLSFRWGCAVLDLYIHFRRKISI